MKRELYLNFGFRCLRLLAVALVALPVVAQVPGRVAERDVLSKLSCKAGDEVQVPIEVVVPGAVALQLDLEYDADMFILDHTTGEAFDVAPGQRFSIHHMGLGVARIVVFSHDLETLPQGLLGSVRLRALESSDQTPIRALRRTVSDASGRALATAVRDGGIVAAQEVGK